ncbi:response regulator transcription factor [Anaeromonas gelatinilytica]|uniref:response regulator transcription factor n=1 Tax=Anaeromonas gelatinilytica TaxID=2683194 RepID=UPI0020785BE5|nr:response regulator transcription factor [Anaeromonas gelatinilytica]
MKGKILVIDDDKEMLLLLERFLSLKGYEVEIMEHSINLKVVLKKSPDLVLLDINMPDRNGFEVCKIIRSQYNVPILFISARSSQEDKIKGLMIGGDDYIVKPFALEELHARIYANLQRENRRKQSGKEECIVINYGRREVRVHDTEIPLTKTEFDIVELLSIHPQRVFEKEHIYTKLWGYDALGYNQVVAEHIRRIRHKIAPYTEKEIIQTVWGVGYRWNG